LPLRNRSFAIESLTCERMRPFLVPLVDQRRVLQELRIRDADVRRVEVAGLVRAEDVAAEARRRTGTCGTRHPALLHGEADLRLRLLLRRERLLLEVRERLRDLRELRVRDQRDVLERDGSTVELLDRGAVRERVERVGGELLLVAADGESGTIEPLPEQLADPVVRADDDVRRRVDGNRGDFLAGSGPDCFWTTWTVTPLLAAQALATFVTAGTRSASPR
jgi:hypothetical protein